MRSDAVAAQTVERRLSSVSDHHDGRRFRDPTGATNKTFGQVLRFLLSTGWAVWPDAVANADYPLPNRPQPGGISATYIGHATVLVQTSDVCFITDPVFSKRAGPFGLLGPKRVRPPGVALSDLPLLDFALVSHNHYDHLDLPSLRALAAAGMQQLVSGLGNKSFLERRRVRPAVELDWWDSVALGNGVRVTFVPAQHWSNRTNFDRNKTLWGGFVVETAAGTIYFAGDTGYAHYFDEIAVRFPRIDLALLPIGAYEPRDFMKLQHMNPEEAVQAHRKLRPRVSIALHFGTFRLTPEPFDAPVKALRAALNDQAVEPDAFRVLDCGETIELSASA